MIIMLKIQKSSYHISLQEDLVSLGKNKTFMISTLAFTCVTFCTGALSWWGPVFIEKALYTVPEEHR